MDGEEAPLVQKKQKYTVEEMKQRAKVSRMKFYQDLAKVPKLTPGKLISLVGWSLGMSAIDNTIVNVALPNIQYEKNFIGESGEGIPQSTIQWVNDIYSIAFASFAIPAAKIGDRYGQTVVHRWGVFAFVVCSALCGVSRFITEDMCPWPYGGFYVLIAARLLQGIAAAFNMANSMALCATLVEQKDVAKSMAMNSLAFAGATALGPVLGGLITDYLGWEYNFFINVVIGAIAITVCWIYLPKTPKFQEDKLDWFGGVIILVGLICLILGFTFIPPDKGATTMGIILACIGAAIVVAFVFWELHHPFAILPRSLLTNKKIILSLCAGLFNFMLITTVSFQMPFCLQTMHCLTPTQSGLMSLVNPVAQMLAAALASYLSKKVLSIITKCVVSILTVAVILTLGMVIDGSIVGILFCMFFFSFFIGTYFTSNNQFMMQTATADIRGMIGGCIQAFRETGFAIGIALVNLVQDIYMGDHWDGLVPNDPTCEDPTFQAYRDVYYDGVFMTDVMMSFVSIITLILGIMSGTNVHESHLWGYPKKLLVQQEAAKVEEGAADERASLIKNQDEETSKKEEK